MENIKVLPPFPPQVLVYEFGARINKEDIPHIDEQIAKARALYNNLIEKICEIFAEMDAFVLSHAGESAAILKTEINALELAFKLAKANSHEDGMRAAAVARRQKRIALSTLLKEVRIPLKKVIQERFLKRIGINSKTDTYPIRCQAVKNGLGWATANAVLDAAMIAFRKRLSLGQPPLFAKASEKTQNALILQFTQAGGVTAESLLSGHNSEIILNTPAPGARKYGHFSFRLGPAAQKCRASGTWQYHRPIPAGSHIARVSLVRKIIGKDTRYYLQFLVKVSDDHFTAAIQKNQKKSLACLHLGWGHTENGRHIAALSEQADPCARKLITLPPKIERLLNASKDAQSERDRLRDSAVPQIKEQLKIIKTPSEAIREECDAFLKLPAQYIAPSRLHRLYGLLLGAALQIEALTDWRKKDRLLHQNLAHTARRARMQRRDFYRKTAKEIADSYQCLCIEPIDMSEAAIKIDAGSGRRTVLAKKARSGRVMAALSEFDAALRWACTKSGTTILELKGMPTVATCSICGVPGMSKSEADPQMLQCPSCGAKVSRKLNGAASAWQHVTDADVDKLIEEAYFLGIAAREKAEAARSEKQTRILEARKKNRPQVDEPVEQSAIDQH